MTEVVFVVPEDGSQIASPDLDWLHEKVLECGEEYWCCGSGQALLRHPDGSRLLLAFAEGHGFFPEFIDRQSEYWISVSQESTDVKVAVWIGGDPIIVSDRFFVSPDTAWIAVREFCTSGSRTTSITWARRSDVEWSFGYWDHPEFEM